MRTTSARNTAGPIPCDAAPVLQQHGCPSVLFVPIAYLDDRQPLPHERASARNGRQNPTLDWEALARFPGTLVFYMGVKQLPRISEQLIAAGTPSMCTILRVGLPAAKCAGLPMTRSSKRAPTASSTSQFCIALLAS